MVCVGIQGRADLADAAVRAQIASLSAELVRSAGFDGVHLDVETVRGSDENFLRLLQEVRAELGPSAKLSVAGAHWTPTIVAVIPVIRNLRWSAGYYREVAEHVDQIAVMSYDSYQPVPALYRLWLREQTRAISTALAGTQAELLMGLSVSREHTRSHPPATENMGSGLAGICAGVRAAGRAGKAVAGIAVYASWEADEQDWSDWVSWQSAASGGTK